MWRGRPLCVPVFPAACNMTVDCQCASGLVAVAIASKQVLVRRCHLKPSQG